ncbi:MAG TPA: glycoside hydrolase family 20 zincin-like fold domain-containing protein [Terracidiphilus sp.]|nr:glycoside hydrolase family 20 zincin-like fold domain-containing protein [Terracidiphilus sp.]
MPSCAELHLVPAVRECKAVETVSIGAHGLDVVADKDPENQFAADDLKDALKADGVSASASDASRIVFLRADGAGKNLLARAQLVLDPTMRDEGYVLVPDGKRGLAVIAATTTGLFYGAQTVKQLVRGSGNDAVLLAPTIRDWPAMAHRGLSDDWSRGPMPSMEFLKREIRTLAAYKYNAFSPYFEHTFAYASTPVAAFPGGAMTPDEGRELVAYAGKYHIVVIPEQEAFGHLHHVLKFEQYAGPGETPHGAVLAPGDPGSLPQIGAWFGELAKVFPGPYVHIGADETVDLGLGRTREEVKQQGMGRVYLDFLSRIHQTLEPNHKRLLFWGDIAENQPELVGTLPKDMIAVPWHYDAKPDFTKAIEPFIKAGLETWVAPGVNNWNRVYPNNNEALGNIRGFVRDGQKLGATGMLNTVWNDDGEGIFDENWFGLLFGAAAAWQPGESSEQEFIASFGQAFHRDGTGKISDAHRALMAAHDVLKKAGLEDAQDRYFWVDPFSAKGQEIGVKLLPVASELRLDAERALTLLAQARAAAPLDNEEALDAMELGARRIDFIGLKFQFAADCSSLYAQAQSIAGDKSREDEVSNLLYTIADNNGRMQDIRDGYSLLGQLYEKAWLRDNRPYWLANNMARYSASSQLWIDRGDKWEAVIDQWETSHTLRPAAEVGLPQH